MSTIKELLHIIYSRDYHFSYDNKMNNKITFEEFQLIKSYISDDLEFIKLCIREIYKQFKRDLNCKLYKLNILFHDGLYYYKYICDEYLIMNVNNYEEKHYRTKEWLIDRSFNHMLFNNKIHLDVRLCYFYTLQKLVRYYYSLELTSLDLFKFESYFDFDLI